MKEIKISYFLGDGKGRKICVTVRYLIQADNRCLPETHTLHQGPPLYSPGSSCDL